MYRGMNNVRIFHGGSHKELAERICERLNQAPGRIALRSFPDGESYVRYEENIRNRDVFLIQPTCPPVNQNLMVLLLMIDAARRASAGSVTVVCPYYGYARQDCKYQSRTPISARLAADLIVTAGADRLLSIDLYTPQIQGFFNIPLDNLQGAPVLRDHLVRNLFVTEPEGAQPQGVVARSYSGDASSSKSEDVGRDHEGAPVQRRKKEDVVVVAADMKAVERAAQAARLLGVRMAVCDKLRSSTRGGDAQVSFDGPAINPEDLRVVGEVQGKFCLIVDDYLDTGKTAAATARLLEKDGAIGIWAFCSHGLFTPGSIGRIEDSPIERVVVLDTAPIAQEVAEHPKVKVVSVAWLLSEAIWRLVNNQSISALFS